MAASVLERSDKAAHICTLLTESAEWAVRSGCLVDMRQIAAVQIREVLKWAQVSLSLQALASGVRLAPAVGGAWFSKLFFFLDMMLMER